MRKTVVAVALAVALGGCSSVPERRDVSDVNVDWENYAPHVRERLGVAIGVGDCDALMREIDNAETNNDAQRERVGDGNDDLIMYIEALAHEEGCYDYDP
jgi:hypothetical protein